MVVVLLFFRKQLLINCSSRVKCFVSFSPTNALEVLWTGSLKDGSSDTKWSENPNNTPNNGLK